MRKSIVTAIIAVATIVCSGAALFVGVGAASSAGASVVPAEPSSIPVFDWHELNNGCDPTAPVCNAADPESVSTAQLTAELAYLKAQGYQTITALQYEQWTEGLNPRLPAKPMFLVDDNGIENFLAGAQPVLAADGFTMAVAVITGFADGASGACSEPAYQPGCPVANEYWDATWAQLRALSPSVYSFIIEAGAAGHFVQDYDPNCTAFYACMAPHETVGQYENRVANDLTQGEKEIMTKIDAARFTSGLWVVPVLGRRLHRLQRQRLHPAALHRPRGLADGLHGEPLPRGLRGGLLSQRHAERAFPHRRPGLDDRERVRDHADPGPGVGLLHPDPHAAGPGHQRRDQLGQRRHGHAGHLGHLHRHGVGLGARGCTHGHGGLER